jgi:hypothetical protein
MSYKYDIYFTHPDNLSKTDSRLSDVINSTIENIKISLSRILRRDITVAAKDTDFTSAGFNKILQQSSVAVVFIVPDFETDMSYISELQQICDFYKLENVNLSSGCNKIFKICLEPPKAALNPACLDELLAYNFYEKNIYNRKVRSLDFSTSDRSASIYSKLLDLAYDISFTLEGGNKNDTVYERPAKSIYLGLTTFDQLQSRDDLRRELQHYGYRVLPQAAMPAAGDEFEKALIACLQQSDTVIELMGSQYGDILKGTKYSLTDYQNRVIREYQQKDEGSQLKRFIWIPLNNKISDQRQALYLKRLRRDDASQNTEIIESPIEIFKTIVASKLQNSNHTPKVQFENISKIYLITEEEQTRETEDLYSSLALSGLRVLILDYSEQVGIYARHLQALRDSDAVVIYQNSTNLAWLNSKIRDIIKAPGIGKLSAFKKVVIVTRLNPDKQLIRMIKSKVELLGEDQFDPEVILNKLISE